MDDAGGADDHREAERDQAVDAADGEAAGEQLGEVHARAHFEDNPAPAALESKNLRRAIARKNIFVNRSGLNFQKDNKKIFLR